MPAVCYRLGVLLDAPPDPTTFYHSFDRYVMYIWQALLRISAQQHPQSGHVALDSTFFERNQGSQHYLQRRSRSVKTVKATTLTNTESLGCWTYIAVSNANTIRRLVRGLSVGTRTTCESWPPTTVSRPAHRVRDSFTRCRVSRSLPRFNSEGNHEYRTHPS
jgi:hypothetical protein